MFVGAGDGHIRYWNCGETAGLITANILYVFDRYDNCRFRGYVGLIHGDGLKQSVDLIKKIYC
jgi:hypothetical protein